MAPMWLSHWFGPPRHLLVLFLAIALALVTALGWLSWRLLEQDRALESQRVLERLDHAADLVAVALLRNLSQTEEQLNGLAALPDAQLAVAAAEQAKQLSADALLVVLRPQRIESYPATRLLYYPVLPASREPPASVFAAGEAFEFQQKDHGRAMAAFREMARSQDVVIRAGALLRLGRNLRKARQSAAGWPSTRSWPGWAPRRWGVCRRNFWRATRAAYCSTSSSSSLMCRTKPKRSTPVCARAAGH